MDGQNRIIPIISLELSCKLLKLEEQLEKVVNSDLEVNIKVKQVTDLLGQIILTEKSLEKFTSMTTKTNPDNKN
jgi:hypothetical protein